MTTLDVDNRGRPHAFAKGVNSYLEIRQATFVFKAGDHVEFLETHSLAGIDFGCVYPPADDSTAIVLDFHNPLSGASN